MNSPSAQGLGVGAIRSRWSEPQVHLAWLVIVGMWGAHRLLIHLTAPSAVPAGTLAVEGAAIPAAAASGWASWAKCLIALAAGAGVWLFVAAVRRLWAGRWLSALSGPRGQHGYYLEAFAFWMFLRIPLNLCFSLWNAWAPWSLSSWQMDVILQAAGLLMLCWPIWRGVTWSALRADLGLHTGEGVLRELGAGVAGYLAKGPLFLFGIICTALLAAVVNGPDGATSLAHPAVSAFSSGSESQRWWILGAALIGAPVVEELAFRGFLFRYLRSGSGRFGRLARVVPSALVTALAFAFAHPTSMLAIPVLAAEGFAFGLVRDWRGSLIAPMVTHALQNGLLLLYFSQP